MTTTTPKIGLFKYDPIQDANQTFNIKKSLNDNWDKLDEALSALADLKDKISPIGRPIMELHNNLADDEIWLEGSVENIATYPKLYEVYGTTYGGDGITTFALPDFKNRTPWGTPDETFGYIEAGLPNITGGFGRMTYAWSPSESGAFWFEYNTGQGSGAGNNGGWTTVGKIAMDASRSNPIYGKSTTVQTPSIKVRVKTRCK